MKECVFLKIADYVILFQSKKINIRFGNAFNRFIIKASQFIDIKVDVFDFLPDDIKNGNEIFKSPGFFEANNKIFKKSDKLWSVVRQECKTRIRVFNNGKCFNVLEIPDNSRNWSIFTNNPCFFELTYPLDSLFLYYLANLSNGIMIHASGTYRNNSAQVFSGISGRGKSTIANIFVRDNYSLIHDDRLIIRELNRKFFVYNTPVYENEYPKKAQLSSVFILGHGDKNSVQELFGMNALTSVASNCIQHNYTKSLLKHLVSFLLRLIATVEVYKLEFVPNNSIVKFLEVNDLV